MSEVGAIVAVNPVLLTVTSLDAVLVQPFVAVTVTV
jgi:hypothetical protein